MQHRHFKLIAAIIAKLPTNLREKVALAFADGLADTNTSFDRDRFITAAMGEPSNGRDR